MKNSMQGKTFDQFELGMEFRTSSRTVTEADVVAFAGLSGDYNAIHTDEEYARSTSYGTRIAHGMLGASISSGLANRLGIFERTVIALRHQAMQYKRPILFGDTVHLELVVTELKGNRRGGRGTVCFETKLINQEGKIVILGRWELLIRGADAPAASDDASTDTATRAASGNGRGQVAADYVDPMTSPPES